MNKSKIKKYSTLSLIGFFLSQYVFQIQCLYEQWAEEKSHAFLRSILFICVFIGVAFILDGFKHLSKLSDKDSDVFCSSFYKAWWYLAGYFILAILAFLLMTSWSGIQTVGVGFIGIGSVVCGYLFIEHLTKTIEAAKIEG